MWYLAELVFAEPPRPESAEVPCESCNVLFDAESAVEACRKAVAWGLAYAAEPPTKSRLLGVAHLTTVGDELADGTEIGGRFFQASAARAGELIPPPDQLQAVRWESGQDTPLGELLSPDQVAQLRRTLGEEPAG